MDANQVKSGPQGFQDVERPVLGATTRRLVAALGVQIARPLQREIGPEYGSAVSFSTYSRPAAGNQRVVDAAVGSHPIQAPALAVVP